jgi:glycosyltransferase involved in cell wall biosynthesis
VPRHDEDISLPLMPAPGRRQRQQVTIVTPYATVGGAELWLQRLLAATKSLNPDVILLQEGPFQRLLEADAIPTEVLPVGSGVTDLLAGMPQLGSALRARQPDVVLANGVKAALLTAPVGRFLGVPTVWAKHDHSYDRWLARPLGRAVTRVVAAAEELGEPVCRHDVVVIPPPRGAAPADRTAARRHWARLGLSLDECLTVVMLGRLVPYKGIDDAVRALGRPHAAAWRLVVIGAEDASAPGERRRLEQLAQSLGVRQRIDFLGPVKEAGRWLAAFDALAVLTKPAGRRTPGKEGFGTSAFEAMLAGVPVIGVEGGAVVRRLAGRAGIGVPPGSPDAVAQALARFCDEAARNAAGQAGRQLVAHHPDGPTAAGTLADILSSAAATAATRKVRRQLLGGTLWHAGIGNTVSRRDAGTGRGV